MNATAHCHRARPELRFGYPCWPQPALWEIFAATRPSSQITLGRLVIRPPRSRRTAAYSDQTFPWTLCRSVHPVHCGKNGGSDPDALWHHSSDGSRDEAGSGVWDRATKRSILLGANLGRAIVTNGVRRTCATVPRRGPLPKLLWANLLVVVVVVVVVSYPIRVCKNCTHAKAIDGFISAHLCFIGPNLFAGLCSPSPSTTARRSGHRAGLQVCDALRTELHGHALNTHAGARRQEQGHNG